MRGVIMRTTLTLDDDVLGAAKAIAQRQNKALGEVISELARHSLAAPIARRERNGIRLLPAGGATAPVTLEQVNALRDEIV